MEGRSFSQRQGEEAQGRAYQGQDILDPIPRSRVQEDERDRKEEGTVGGRKKSGHQQGKSEKPGALQSDSNPGLPVIHLGEVKVAVKGEGGLVTSLVPGTPAGIKEKTRELSNGQNKNGITVIGDGPKEKDGKTCCSCTPFEKADGWGLEKPGQIN